MRESDLILGKPIVFERSKKKKKKKRSSTLRDIAVMERYMSRAMHRSIRAMDNGLATYRKESKKSARRSKDGAIVNFVPNVIKGGTAVIQEAALIPLDLMRATYTPTGKRLVRRTIRFVAQTMDEAVSS